MTEEKNKDGCLKIIFWTLPLLLVGIYVGFVYVLPFILLAVAGIAAVVIGGVMLIASVVVAMISAIADALGSL